jgi:hypothetical protein
MILHWDQLVLHYGPEVGVHRPHFAAAGQTTYGLLCCRFTPSDYRLGASSGDHAEARLLQSTNWVTELPQALADWTPRSSPIIVTLAINRSPCQNCASLLVAALEDVYRQHPVAANNSRFILASRGAYEDAHMRTATRQNDLVRMAEAGWELCVLVTDPEPSARGDILLEGIERVAGRGYVRLG